MFAFDMTKNTAEERQLNLRTVQKRIKWSDCARRPPKNKLDRLVEPTYSESMHSFAEDEKVNYFEAQVYKMAMNTTTGKVQLQNAIAALQAELSPTQRHDLPADPSLEDIIHLVDSANAVHSKKPTRRCGEKIKPFLLALFQFSGTVDFIVRSNPEIASIVWGSIKYVFTLLMEHSKYFDKLVDVLERMGLYCPLMEECQRYLRDRMLQDVLCEFYAIVVQFCQSVLKVLLSKKPKTKAIWKSLKGALPNIEAKVERHREHVNACIGLASEKAHYQQRQMDAHFRQQALDYRMTGPAHWDNATKWRLQQDRRQKKMMRDILLERITGHDYYDMYLRNLGKSTKGTGDWIFNLDEFKDWEDGSSGSKILWFHGIPGSGKSVLSAGVNKYLCTKYPGSAAFYFFNYQQVESLQWETVVRSLLRQLLAHTEQFEHIIELFETPMSPNDLVNALSQVLGDMKMTYLVIDGIDECIDTDKYKLLEIFDSIIKQPNVKLFVASRFNADVSRSIRSTYVCELPGSKYLNQDIEKYIDFRLSKRIQENHLVFNQHICDEIKVALLAKAEGMFVYVSFQIDEICAAMTEDMLRACLENLPRGLLETYDRILEKIEKFGDLLTAKKVLSWVMEAARPLTLEELSEATAFDLGDTSYRQGRFHVDKQKIILKCANLVTMENRTGSRLVHFAHSTVPEHLRKTGFIVDRTAHVEASQVCLTYLSLTDFERQITNFTGNGELVISSPEDSVSIMLSSLDIKTPPTTITNIIRFRELGRLGNSNSYFPSTEKAPLKSCFAYELQNANLLDALGLRYPFLQYACQYWLSHCRVLKQDLDEQAWSSFAKLVLHSNLPFDHLPWTEYSPVAVKTDFTGMEWNRLRWAVLNEHLGLIELLHSHYSKPVWDAILRSHTDSGEICYSADEAFEVFIEDESTDVPDTLFKRALSSTPDIRSYMAKTNPAYAFRLAVTLMDLPLIKVLLQDSGSFKLLTEDLRIKFQDSKRLMGTTSLDQVDKKPKVKFTPLGVAIKKASASDIDPSSFPRPLQDHPPKDITIIDLLFKKGWKSTIYPEIESPPFPIVSSPVGFACNLGKIAISTSLMSAGAQASMSYLPQVVRFGTTRQVVLMLQRASFPNEGAQTLISKALQEAGNRKDKANFRAILEKYPISCYSFPDIFNANILSIMVDLGLWEEVRKILQGTTSKFEFDELAGLFRRLFVLERFDEACLCLKGAEGLLYAYLATSEETNRYPRAAKFMEGIEGLQRSFDEIIGYHSRLARRSKLHHISDEHSRMTIQAMRETLETMLQKGRACFDSKQLWAAFYEQNQMPKISNLQRIGDLARKLIDIDGGNVREISRGSPGGAERGPSNPFKSQI